jgi:hypothetical protein
VTIRSIYDLPEASANDLATSDYFIISTEDTSYKVTLDNLNTVLVELSSGTFQEITNSIINDITNVVNANAVHLLVSPVADISKGTPVSLVVDVGSDLVKVKPASSDDIIIGLAETNLLNNIPGAVMTLGILDGLNMTTEGYLEGEVLYWQDGAITTNPINTVRKQMIGYVLNGGDNGKLLISEASSLPVASDIGYNNLTSGLTAGELQSAVDELSGRIVNLEQTTFKGPTAPTVGVDEGDTWYNTTLETYNIYREWPSGSTIFSWQPMLYKDYDILDGGAWV